MNRTNELLDKFFKAETDLAEENELKKYFNGNNVLPEHEIYRPMFDAFNDELKVEPTLSVERFADKQQKTRINWIKLFSYSGIAAALAIVLWTQRPQQTDNYAVILGTTVEDTEFAEKYAEKKLQKAGDILKNGMKPMQNFEKVRNCLEPMQKLNDTKQKIDDIKDKLQIK